MKFKTLLFLVTLGQFSFSQNTTENDSIKKITKLEEVIVSANKSEQKNLEVPVAVTSIYAKSVTN